MRFSFFRSIRSQLLLLVFISVFPALAIVIYSGLERQHHDIEDAKDSAIRVVQSLAIDHEHTVESTRKLLITLAKSPAVQNKNASACSKLFGSFIKENPVYGNIFAANAEGTIFSSSLPFTPHTVKNRKFFRDVLRTMDFSVGEQVIGTIIKQPVLHFAYPITGAGGQFKGVVVAAFDLAHYGQMFTKIQLPAGSVIGIFDHKNIRLYRSEEPEKYIGELDRSEMIKHMSAQPEEGVFTDAGVDGTKRLYAYKRFYLKDSASPYLFMRVGIPEEQALSHARNTILINMALLCSAFIIAIVLAWFLGNVIIVQRLNKLADATKRLGRGDLKVRTGLGYSEDELGRVTKAFDDMAGELERKEAERERAEEALRESEERYWSIFHNSHATMLLIDPETADIIDANPAACTYYGYTFAELTAKKITDINTLTEEQVFEEMARARNEQRSHFDFSHRLACGEIRAVEVFSGPIKLGGKQLLYSIVHDITERKQAEKMIRAHADQYSTILMTTPDGFWLVDDRGRLLDVNEAYCRMSGFTREELLRLSIPDLEAAEKADETERHMRKIIGSGSDRFESRHVTKDGRIFDVEISVTFLANKRWFIVFVRDISNRKQAEQTLAERTAQLEAANKELESFSYSVSHDLRAPLRAIDGYARMILKRQADKFDEDTLSKFNVIRSSTQMMGQLIDDLLAFSHLGRKDMSMSKIDMDQLVREVWTVLIDVNPGRNMIMTVNGIPPGCGDRSLIKQVYFNLISNAVKFTKYRDAARIEAGGYTEGNENIYYVRDNGTGFDMAYYDKLFGVFQRLHNGDDFEGTGVGLATVQRIVHRPGGRVWAEGKVDEGATFYFSLPSSERPASAEMAI